MPRAIDVFFYGLFMDADALRARGLQPSAVELAELPGWALRIGRRATLVPERGTVTHGVAMRLTHGELRQLYAGAGLESYEPEAVLVALRSGARRDERGVRREPARVGAAPRAAARLHRVDPVRDYGATASRPFLMLALLVVVAPAAGCTIRIEANAVQSAPQGTEEICLIENPPVRAEFLSALTVALKRKGFGVRVLSPIATPADCPLTATYSAKWSWDFVPYMATADITVFLDGAKVGDAIYRAPRGGWSLTFGIYRSTTTKVGRMVDQLFPNRP